MINVEIIKDSVSPFPKRITTFLLTYPRFIHAEMLRHRCLSRSAQSSRAVPTNKLLERVKTNPVIPLHWGQNQGGMQADTEVSEVEQNKAKGLWLETRDEVVRMVEELQKIKIHKQIINRLLEPFCTITEVVTGTDWGNFFNLRVHKDAQPEIRVVAEIMLDLYTANTPQRLEYGEWHLPFVDEDLDLQTKIKVSFARCARASYVNFYGKKDIDDDIKLHDDLVPKFHISPSEHQTKAKSPEGWDRSEYTETFTKINKTRLILNQNYGDYILNKREYQLYGDKDNPIEFGEYRYYFKNLDGWKPYRSTIHNENRHNFDKEDLLRGLE